MIIEKPKEDLFSFLPHAVPVCTVNCVGIMGKGVALEFKNRYPNFYEDYRKACKKNEIKIGECKLWEYNTFFTNLCIITFPTKTHWKYNSEYSYIEKGLDSLNAINCEKPIILPRLGCGNGGLNWNIVREMIIGKLNNSQNAYILI